MSEKFHNSTERRTSDSTVDSETCVIKEEREGGVAAWLTVVGSVLVYYCSMGVLNSFGFFNNYYSNDFLQNTPTSTIAFIGTLQIALMNSLAAVSGALCDFYGVRVRIDALGLTKPDADPYSGSILAQVAELQQVSLFSPLRSVVAFGKSFWFKACLSALQLPLALNPHSQSLVSTLKDNEQ